MTRRLLIFSTLVVAASVVLSAQLSPPALATAKIGEAALSIPLCPLSRSGPQARSHMIAQLLPVPIWHVDSVV